MDLFRSIKTYLRVVDEGSFSGAARRMNTTSSALTKQVQGLESHLGVQLLKRTTRSVTQTEAGSVFYDRAKQQLDNWQSVFDETRSVNQSPAGVLKIGATSVVGSRFLMDYLEGFFIEYPEIRVMLITTTPGEMPELSLDLYITREIDNLNSLSFIGTPLFHSQVGFYASPSYIQRKGVPESLDQLDDHDLLVWTEQTQTDLKLMNGDRITLQGKLMSSNSEALFHAAKRGAGILLAHEFMTKHDVNDGSLIRILNQYSANEKTIYAYYPKLAYTNTRAKLFMDYLKKRLADANE